MFAWDLFCEFRDRLKIAKFYTRELEHHFFFFKSLKKNHLYVPPSLSILAIVNVSADGVNVVDFDKSIMLFCKYRL